MSKIEIKGTVEDLQRIAVFLENNHIEHSVVDDIHFLKELEEAIEWPF